MLGNIFISGQALRIGPNKIEQFVPGQFIADRRPQRTNVLPRYFHHSFVLAFMLTNFTLISFFTARSNGQLRKWQEICARPRSWWARLVSSPAKLSTAATAGAPFSCNIVDTLSGPFFVRRRSNRKKRPTTSSSADRRHRLHRRRRRPLLWIGRWIRQSTKQQPIGLQVFTYHLSTNPPWCPRARPAIPSITFIRNDTGKGSAPVCFPFNTLLPR